ncbi:MAG: septum formation initiator family protein [Patescibacteria group bacterium]|jgi:cell division protein FtsB
MGMKNWSRRILTSKWFLVVCLLFLIFLSYSFIREFSRRYYLQKQVNALEEQVNKIEKENQEFSQLIEYFDTQNFTEEEARVKMGLKKPGEEVVVINQSGKNEVNNQEQDGFAGLSNPSKWWYYFFKQNKS